MCQASSSDWRLHGVASDHSPGCRTSMPSVFARVMNQSGWINRESGKH